MAAAALKLRIKKQLCLFVMMVLVPLRLPLKEENLLSCLLHKVNDIEVCSFLCQTASLILSTGLLRNLDRISQEALGECFSRLAAYAEQKGKTSVHLPRIGYGVRNIQWYVIERLIRKHLTAKGIPTYVYYFQRRSTLQSGNFLFLDTFLKFFYICSESFCHEEWEKWYSSEKNTDNQTNKWNSTFCLLYFSKIPMF